MFKYLNKFAESELAEELDFGHTDAVRIADAHDTDKLPGGENYDAYCVISYLYWCKQNDVDSEIEYSSELDDATTDHIKRNSHHPEYWDESYKPVRIDNFHNRDSTTVNSVSGEKMDDESIIEMCCDWSSVGEHRGNTPQAWADQVREGKRYRFTEVQWDLIYEILGILTS